MQNKKLKSAAIVMIMAICINLINVQRSEAVALVDDITIAVIVAALGTVGYECVTDDGMRASAAYIWDSATDKMKENFLYAKETGKLLWDLGFFNDMWAARDALEGVNEAGTPIEFQVPYGNLPLVTSESNPTVTANIGDLMGNVSIYSSMMSKYNAQNPRIVIWMGPSVSSIYFDAHIETYGGDWKDGAWGSYAKVVYVIRSDYGGINLADGTIEDCNKWQSQTNGVQQFNDVNLSVNTDDNGTDFYVNGTLVYSGNVATVGNKINRIVLEGQTDQWIGGYYDSAVTGSKVLNPGVDYTINQTITNNYAGTEAGTVGTEQTVDLEQGGVTDTTITAPGTVTDTADTEGVISWLSTIWNSMAQSLQNIYAQVSAILASLTAAFAQPPTDFFDPFIGQFKLWYNGQIPQFTNLDTGQFSEPDINWTITINYPVQVTFQVLNQEMIDKWRPTVRQWSGAVMIVFTCLYVWKRLPEVVKG